MLVRVLVRAWAPPLAVPLVLVQAWGQALGRQGQLGRLDPQGPLELRVDQPDLGQRADQLGKDLARVLRLRSDPPRPHHRAGEQLDRDRAKQVAL